MAFPTYTNEVNLFKRVYSTVDSALFVAATGGLNVDAIPGEISTRIILNSSKSQILAQAINVSAKGVK